jgi:hypothetical protein
MTMKIFGKRYVEPSTVTWDSSMHSSRLDWVRGVVLLISSARRTLVNTGPGLNSNSFFFWLNMDTPVMSDGRRSGVNCTLFSAERAIRHGRASMVY